jgi:N-acetylmuramoyl-L-alanine amidase
MAALETLAAGIMGRHGIGPWRVLGHSDVAPARKQDPGELFDWKRLAAKGLAVYPDETAVAPADRVVADLAAYGYDGEGSLAAFQRHFRPERIDGVADVETAGRLRDLLTRRG